MLARAPPRFWQFGLRLSLCHLEPRRQKTGGSISYNKKQRTIETTCLLRILQVMITSTQPYLNSLL